MKLPIEAQEIRPTAAESATTKSVFQLFVYEHLRHLLSVHSEVLRALSEVELKKFEKKLGQFFTFFPEHRGKALYGLIAAVDVARGLETRAAR